MTVLVIGYGSIGSRHARILREMGGSVLVLSSRPVKFSPRVKSLKEAFEKKDDYKYVVITNETAKHYKTLCDLERIGFRGNVLVEKPLFFREKPRKFKFKRIMVAYNLRFHPLLLRLRAILKDEKIISVQSYVGKYLPDWRQKRDYRNGYWAHRSAGGGVLRELSHELDFLCWILGRWKKVAALGGHFSELEIDSDDVFSLLFSTDRCPVVSVQMNFLDRSSRRYLIINTNAHTFRADLISGILEIDGKTEAPLMMHPDDSYRAEHQAVEKNDFERLCSWKEGLDVNRLISAAEKASKLGTWVTR